MDCRGRVGWASLALAALSFSLFSFCFSFGCNAESPPRGPEHVCVKACSVRAPHCDRAACARGCNLVLDRLVEKEGNSVVACVVNANPRCDDRTWAACAARIGPHADGGPPAPPLPSDVEPDPE